jgi:hypothetical protein
MCCKRGQATFEIKEEACPLLAFTKVKRNKQNFDTARGVKRLMKELCKSQTSTNDLV